MALEIDGKLNNEAQYYMSSYSEILSTITNKGNEVMEKLTQQTNCTMLMPLAYQFQLTATIKDFINSSIGNIIVFLAILLATLMYSLMLQDVNQKTYEFGMLRALGWKKKYLVSVISLKSLAFSCIGVTVGMTAAAIINMGLREAMFVESWSYLTYELTTISVVMGITFGILTPFLANYWPIKASMDKDLRNSLDMTRSKSADMFGVKIQRLENVGMSLTKVGLAVFLIVVGVLVYYGVPMSFLNSNYFSALLILGFVLIFVIIGLTFLCSLLFSYLEQFMLWATLQTCCRKDRRLHSLIRQTMDGHQIRNQKTSIIYTLAIAFLLLAASYFSMLSVVIEKALANAIGSDVTVYGWYTMIDEGPVSKYLDDLKAEEGQPVTSYSFLSYSFHSILDLGTTSGDTIKLVGAGLDVHINLIGVPENFFDTQNTELYVQKQVQSESDFPEGSISELPNGDLNPVEMLYSSEGLTPAYPETNPNVNAFNAYKMTFSNYATPYSPWNSNYGDEIVLDNLSIVLPGVFGDLLPVSAGDWIKLQ